MEKRWSDAEVQKAMELIRAESYEEAGQWLAEYFLARIEGRPEREIGDADASLLVAKLGRMADGRAAAAREAPASATAELGWQRCGDRIRIDAQATCGPRGGFESRGVAYVYEPENPNPGVVFGQIVGVNLAEQVIEFVKTRPWENDSA